jgi:hypothetical protein
MENVGQLEIQNGRTEITEWEIKLGGKVTGKGNGPKWPNAKWEIINLLLSENKRIKVKKKYKNKQNVKIGKVRKIRKVKEKKTLAFFF